MATPPYTVTDRVRSPLPDPDSAEARRRKLGYPPPSWSPQPGQRVIGTWGPGVVLESAPSKTLHIALVRFGDEHPLWVPSNSIRAAGPALSLVYDATPPEAT